ncbi:hypothetical protein HDV05_003741 [Chytridiales sp. JEL 0842]|nr:hypothetical protein HDV05_003741 [Chytridiales sp. JEL 0842]
MSTNNPDSESASDERLHPSSRPSRRTIEFLHLPNEILAHILHFVTSGSLLRLFRISKRLSALAIHEWDTSRLPPLLPGTILAGSARCAQTSRSFGKIVLFARVLDVKTYPYTGSKAKVEFLQKMSVDSVVRGGCMVFVSQVPKRPLAPIKIPMMGQRVWLRRALLEVPASGGDCVGGEGGVVFDIKASGLTVYEPEYGLAKASVALKVWDGKPVDGFTDRHSVPFGK